MIGFILMALMKTLQVITTILALFMAIMATISYIKIKKSLPLILAFLFVVILFKPFFDVLFRNYGVIIMIKVHVITTFIVMLLIVISYAERIRYVRRL